MLTALSNLYALKMKIAEERQESNRTEVLTDHYF